MRLPTEPIGSIQCPLRLIRAAEVLEGLAVIDRNARVQAQLIEDLLDMSRIISGKVRLDVQRVDLQELVSAAIASVRPSADSKGIRVQVVVDPEAGPVWGDPSRLQQCFWNLLSNAIKFTPKGGRVQVSLARVNSQLAFTVVDDGQGIAPEFLPHVFERFRQADSSTTRYHGGLGLDLSIVKSLVELHGSTVRAESAGTGLGATFCIELPVMVVGEVISDRRREHPAKPTVPVAPLEHPSLHGITVLAVDDEPDARGLVKRVLEECGAERVRAARGPHARAARRIPDAPVEAGRADGADGGAREPGETPVAARSGTSREPDPGSPRRLTDPRSDARLSAQPEIGASVPGAGTGVGSRAPWPTALR